MLEIRHLQIKPQNRSQLIVKTQNIGVKVAWQWTELSDGVSPSKEDQAYVIFA